MIRFGRVQPPITRQEQLQGALAGALVGVAWGEWGGTGDPQCPTPTWPTQGWELPLPDRVLTGVRVTLQAWLAKVQSGDTPQPWETILEPQDLGESGNLDFEMDPGWLLITALQARDGDWSQWINSPVWDNTPQAWVGLYRQNLHQSLQHPGQLAPLPREIGHWYQIWQHRDHPLAQAMKKASLRAQGLAWGSLYGANWGWGHLPPLWVAVMPAELRELTLILLGAWAGCSGAAEGSGALAVTPVGRLYPRSEKPSAELA